MRHPEAPAPGELLGAHYGECFGCGGGQPHGLHLAARAGEGVSLTAEFTVRPAHQGAPGLAHGGVLATALDETLGSLNWLLRRIAVTGRLETDFVTPVPVGSMVRIDAACLGVAGRKIYTAATGTLTAPDGGHAPAVRSAALFVEVPVEHFTAFGHADLVHASLNRSVESVEVNP